MQMQILNRITFGSKTPRSHENLREKSMKNEKKVQKGLHVSAAKRCKKQLQYKICSCLYGGKNYLEAAPTELGNKRAVEEQIKR